MVKGKIISDKGMMDNEMKNKLCEKEKKTEQKIANDKGLFKKYYLSNRGLR